MNVLPLQQGLKARGFDPGPRDGAIGPKTLQAAAELATSGKAPADTGATLARYLTAAGLITRLRLIHFLAQIAHESDFIPRTENLNYSAEGLVKTWPGRFRTIVEAAPYARHPEKIANKVYASRYGNGNEASGDGWRFRGRGWCQLTFRANYERFGFADNPDALLTMDGAAKAAAMYWIDKDINTHADRDDIATVTQKVNGGTVGFADRLRITNLLKGAWPE
jgi:putative chitinase